MPIIIFNGPKHSGKTTAIRHLLDYDYSSGTDRMIEVKASEFVSDAICSLLGMDSYTFNLYYDLIKDEPMKELSGMSIRQAMIWLSEDVMKPKFGLDVFGSSTVTAMRRFFSIMEDVGEEPVILGDIGFDAEAKCVVDTFGPENVFLVRIERPEHNFVGDSRSYLNADAIGILPENVFIVENSSSLEDFKSQIDEILKLVSPHREVVE